MVDAPNNKERRALIFAPANDQAGQSLQLALQHVGFTVALVVQLSHGLGVLRGGRSVESPCSIVIILSGQSGLSGPIIAQALRGVPELAELPIILVSDTPVPLARCVVISHLMSNADICALALQDPQSWRSPVGNIAPISISSNHLDSLPAIPMNLPHTMAVTPDEEFDPNPLIKICKRSPGSAKEIIALIRSDLVRALEELPRLQSNGDLAALAKAAHKIHGASGSIGAMAIYNTCFTLEKIACVGNLAESQIAVNAALSYIRRFIQRLDRFFITPN